MDYAPRGRGERRQRRGESVAGGLDDAQTTQKEQSGKGSNRVHRCYPVGIRKGQDAHCVSGLGSHIIGEGIVPDDTGRAADQ